MQEARRFGTLEEDEVAVLPGRGLRDEVELLPQGIELATLLVLENQLAQRLVIAEIALHEMEAGGQRPSLPCCPRVEVGTAIGNDKGRRKRCAESLQRPVPA